MARAAYYNFIIVYDATDNTGEPQYTVKEYTEDQHVYEAVDVFHGTFLECIDALTDRMPGLEFGFHAYGR